VWCDYRTGEFLTAMLRAVIESVVEFCQKRTQSKNFLKRAAMNFKGVLNTCSVIASLAAVAGFAASSAQADNTGFDSIHGKIRVGGRVCFDGHSHGGSGSGASRKVAEMRAVSSWYDYTAGEYGSDWANIHKAIKKSMRCSQSGAGWSCDVEATPCR